VLALRRPSRRRTLRPRPLIRATRDTNLYVVDVVNDRIRASPDVTSTEVFTYLSLVKQTYSWGVR